MVMRSTPLRIAGSQPAVRKRTAARIWSMLICSSMMLSEGSQLPGLPQTWWGPGVMNLSRKWLVLGFSAGGHLSLKLSRQADTVDKDDVRSVAAINSPITFWHEKGIVVDAIDVSPRTIDYPGTGGVPATVGFPSGDNGHASGLINGLFRSVNPACRAAVSIM